MWLALYAGRVHSSTLVAAEATELLVLRRDDYAAMTAMAQQALHVRSGSAGGAHWSTVKGRSEYVVEVSTWSLAGSELLGQKEDL